MAENDPSAIPAADDPFHAERAKYSAAASASGAQSPIDPPVSISRKALFSPGDYERALDALDLIFGTFSNGVLGGGKPWTSEG
jgi:hypothetical protein